MVVVVVVLRGKADLKARRIHLLDSLIFGTFTIFCNDVLSDIEGLEIWWLNQASFHPAGRDALGVVGAQS